MSIASALASVNLVCGGDASARRGLPARAQRPVSRRQCFVLAGVGGLLATAFREPSWSTGSPPRRECSVPARWRSPCGLLVADSSPRRCGGIAPRRSSADAALRARLRVATYNVHGVVGTDGDTIRSRRRPSSANWTRTSSRCRSSPTRRRRTGLAYTGRVRGAGPLRCALGRRADPRPVLRQRAPERHRLVEVRRIDLSIQRREPRGALAATVD